MDKIKEILKDIDPDVFTPEIQQSLVAIVQEKVEAANKAGYEAGMEKGIELTETKLDDDHSEKLEKLVEGIDEDHANKLQQLLEKIDEDHAEKLSEVIDTLKENYDGEVEELQATIDADHTEKLEKIVEFYEAKYEEQIVEAISDFLDTYVEELTPSAEMVDAARLNSLEEAIKSIKKVVVVSDEFVQTEVRQAMNEAKAELDKRQSEVDTLIAEKIELKKTIKLHEASKKLEEKTSSMSPGETAYVTKYLRGCTAEEIEERIDEAVAAYKDDSALEREKAKEGAKTSASDVDVPIVPDVNLNESVEETLEETLNESNAPFDIDAYTTLLERSIK